MKERHPNPRPSSPRRQAFAFTLLEVLLATVLAVTLLAALWSLLSMQTRLYATVPAEIERCQLARAVFQQFADDLGRVIFVPTDEPGKSTTFLSADGAPASSGPVASRTAVVTPAASPAGSAGPTATATATVGTATITTGSSGRPSTLVGTEQSLHMQVLNVLLPEPATEREDQQPDEDRQPRAPELCSVAYTFQSPDEVESTDPIESAPPVGLLRREVPWDTPDANTGAARMPWFFHPQSSAESSAEPTNDLVDDSRQGQSSTLPAAQRPVEHTTEVPEVIGIEFRYFDGSTWSSWWDSRERRSLPVAIEVTIQFTTDRQGRRRSSTLDKETKEERSISSEEAAQGLASQDGSAEDLSPDATAGDAPRPGRYHFVVFLPTAPRQAEQPRRTETTGTEIPETP